MTADRHTARRAVTLLALVVLSVVAAFTFGSPAAVADTASLLGTRVAASNTDLAGSVGPIADVVAGQGRETDLVSSTSALGCCVATRATASVADDLAVAESHLGSIDAMTGPNRMMLDRIAGAQQSGRALTTGEQNFLLHETTEARLVGQGLSQDAAHAGALETHPLFSNYDPEVIKAFPEYFNSNWRNFWGIG